MNISDKIIEGQADAMVSQGLKEAGYQYINIDDGFWDGRAKDGQLIINRKRFPNGMRAVADYIHKLGLKAGIYSDAGDNDCGSKPMGWGLDWQDMRSRISRHICRIGTTILLR